MAAAVSAYLRTILLRDLPNGRNATHRRGLTQHLLEHRVRDLRFALAHGARQPVDFASTHVQLVERRLERLNRLYRGGIEWLLEKRDVDWPRGSQRGRRERLVRGHCAK